VDPAVSKGIVSFDNVFDVMVELNGLAVVFLSIG